MLINYLQFLCKHSAFQTLITEMASWAKNRATLFIIHQVHFSHQLPLILVDSYLASESHYPFILPYCHVSEAVNYSIRLFLKSSDLV